MNPPVKPEAAPAPAPRPRWVLPAAAAGLLVLATGVAIAIALPITMRNNSSRGFTPLSADGLEVPPGGVDRTYYLAADAVDWDYAPTGKNLCKGTPFGDHEALYVSQGAGRKYKKAVYREYTDDTFKVTRPR